MKALLIVPAYNEEESIPFVLNDLKNVGADVLVVNDGSSDGTAEAAEAGGAIVVTHPFNIGIGGTVQTGLRYALRNGYDFAVQFDGDGQHRADQIGLITEMVAAGAADLVIGARTAESGYRYGACRFAGSRLLAAITRLLSGRSITDPTSGFRCYGKEAIRIFSRYYPDDYPEVETIVMAARNGLRIKEVPVLMRQRVAGSSSITPRKSIYYMLKVSLALMIDALRRPSLESEEVC